MDSKGSDQDSEPTVWEYYRGKTVFLTGGSGFLGTAILHRLVFNCEVKKVYLLCRGGKSRLKAQWTESLKKDRADWLLSNEKIAVWQGDITSPGLGLIDSNLTVLQQEVEIIIHGASSINLVHSAHKASETIVKPAIILSELALQCTQLERFVYVSTAYANANLASENPEIDTLVEECIYPLRAGEKEIRPLEDEINELTTTGSTVEFESNDFPWAYGYAKHLSERLATSLFCQRNALSKLLIVRPSIIGPAESYPFPGYAVAMSTPLTVLAAAVANSPATQFHIASRLPDPHHQSTGDEVPVDVVVDRLLAHLAFGTTGCVHAVCGSAGRFSVQDVHEALRSLRWVPWDFHLRWLKSGWHCHEQHPVSRIFKVCGTSFDFREDATKSLWESLDEGSRRSLHLFGRVDGLPYELLSRKELIYQCVLHLTARMNPLYGFLTRLS